MNSMPRTSDRHTALKPIPGSLPDLTSPPAGCVFASRCKIATEQCGRDRPAPLQVAAMQTARCFYPERAAEIQAARDASLSASARVDTAGGRLALEIDGLSCTFRQRSGLPFIGAVHETKAVADVSLAIPQGGTLAVVGESGSGKSTLARLVIGLLSGERGDIRFENKSLAKRAGDRDLALQRRLQMIFQNPDGALNPQLTIGEIIARPLQLYGRAAKADIPQRVNELLGKVRLAPRYASRLPHELSGGEKQRVNIARVMAADPDVIVCDEPTSALDISVQASVLNQLRELQANTGVTYLFISHDLAVVRYISDTVAVMYRGRVVETGPTEAVFSGPHHPYTESLLDAIPELDKPRRPTSAVASGSDPETAGCHYASRCAYRIEGACDRIAPALRDIGAGRLMACHVPAAELAARQTRKPESVPA